jgi:hypothetical protein
MLTRGVAKRRVVGLCMWRGDDITPTTKFQRNHGAFPLKKNPVYDAVVLELDNAGIRHTRYHRGKHEAVEFEIGGQRQFIIVPASPSDWRAPRAARCHVRRVLRKQR